MNFFSNITCKMIFMDIFNTSVIIFMLFISKIRIIICKCSQLRKCNSHKALKHVIQRFMGVAKDLPYYCGRLFSRTGLLLFTPEMVVHFDNPVYVTSALTYEFNCERIAASVVSVPIVLPSPLAVWLAK